MRHYLIMRNNTDKQHQLEFSKYKQYLNRHHIRMSRARETIFWEVMQAHGHFTAEELAKQCQEPELSVSRATVYRCLRELLEAGIVRETAFGDKHHHFEHMYDEKPHHHARCTNCHQFIEIPDLNEDTAYHPILKKHGFKILGHELHFYGICKQCQEKKDV